VVRPLDASVLQASLMQFPNCSFLAHAGSTGLRRLAGYAPARSVVRCFTVGRSAWDMVAADHRKGRTMVSAIDSTRLVSAQYALKNLRGSDDNNSQSATDSSGAASILSSYGLDPDTSSLLSNNALASLLDTLSAQSDQTEETTDTSNDNPDMTSSSFMAMLKKQLEEAAEREGTDGTAHDMLAALENGTLTISDPTQGVSITAWDVDNPDEADTDSKPGTDIEASGWNDFLNAHLKRGDDASFVKQGDHYVDKIDNSSAHFGQIGLNFYYLTWPQATAK